MMDDYKIRPLSGGFSEFRFHGLVYIMPTDHADHIAASLEACRWRPIEEAPKDGTDILAVVAGAKIPAIVHWEEDYGWMDDYDDPDVYFEWNPTHWRPIGPLPKKETRVK